MAKTNSAVLSVKATSSYKNILKEVLKRFILSEYRYSVGFTSKINFFYALQGIMNELEDDLSWMGELENDT